MEFEFSDKDFSKLSHLVTDYSGIMVPEEKKMLVYSRLAKRVRALGMDSFSAYVSQLEKESGSGSSKELVNVINAMTTNVTKFFREGHHFTALRDKLIEMAKEGKRSRIWSSASSSGEEPWSIAMVVADVLKEYPQAKITVYASDLDTTILDKAKAATYKISPCDVDDNKYLKRYLIQQGDIEKNSITGDVAVYKVHPDVHKLVTFSQLNLIKPFPVSLEADIIFCRNVIIYFDKDNKIALFKKIAKLMPKDGLLCIGHSESLMGVSEQFDSIGKTMYIRNSVSIS